MINRVPPTKDTDTWITPLPIIKTLGVFDLDPCCPDTMPYPTAIRMIMQPNDGLSAKWEGYVWCNPPYSNILPWATKMVEHGNGIMLVPAKSTETKWGQLLLNNCNTVLFQKGRLLFNYQDGSPSFGKWAPYMFVAFGEHATVKLELAVKSGKLEGVIFRPYGI